MLQNTQELRSDKQQAQEEAPEILEVYQIASSRAREASTWQMTMASDQVKLQQKDGKGVIEVTKEQARQKIGFPGETVDGRGELEHLRGLPVVKVGGQNFAMTPKLRNILQEWIPPLTVDDLKKELHGWGIGLIGLGIAHLVFSNFLNPGWAFIIIPLGVLNLMVRHRGMLLVNGIMLIMVAIMNIAAGVAFLGVLQIVWGIQEITKFNCYGSMRTEGVEEQR